MMFITTSAMAENKRNVSFDQAKKDMKTFVYYDHPETFYCHVYFDDHNKVDLPEDFEAPKYKNRAGRMEWEHIVPAENFGRDILIFNALMREVLEYYFGAYDLDISTYYSKKTEKAADELYTVFNMSREKGISSALYERLQR